MRRLLLTGAILAAMSLPASAATLFIEAFDNGALVGSAQSGTGTLSLHVMDDPAFSIFAISAFGPPSLPGGDLLSILDTVASSSISGTHTLEVDIFQSDLAWPARPITSTLNSYTFGLSVGPTTETAAINGGPDALGTPIESNTFAIGADATVGPLTTGAPALFADANQYTTSFSAPDERGIFGITMTTAPETSTWAMMLLGFAGLSFVGSLARRRTAAAA